MSELFDLAMPWWVFVLRAAAVYAALMVLQVHDELVFEVDADFVPVLLEQVSARMAAAASLLVPLVVDCGVGDNWDEAH